MHYYFDVLANLDETLWEFYEWEKKDAIIPIKKVPLVRVSNNTLKELMTYNVKFSLKWVDLFKGKTVLKNSQEHPLLILFSSTKNCLILELDQVGNTIYRSKLLIEDEINCNEIAYGLKEETVFYEKKAKIARIPEFRRALEEKRLLSTELKNIRKENNIEKCSYLYFEWFSQKGDSLSDMLLKMEQELENPYTLKIHQIVELIRLSYREPL